MWFLCPRGLFVYQTVNKQCKIPCHTIQKHFASSRQPKSQTHSLPQTHKHPASTSHFQQCRCKYTNTFTTRSLSLYLSLAHIKNENKKLQLWQQCCFLLQKQALNSQLPFCMLVAEINSNWPVNWVVTAGVYYLHLHYGLPSMSTQGSLVSIWLHHLSPKYYPKNQSLCWSQFRQIYKAKYSVYKKCLPKGTQHTLTDGFHTPTLMP